MSSLYNFLKRHRRKLLWGGAAVGGAVLLSRLVDNHLNRVREAQGKEALEQIRLRNYYEMTECTYNSTFTHLFQQLKLKIIQTFDAEALIEALRQKPVGEEKLRLWAEMKLVCFNKAAAMVICQTFLGILVRVQLNVLAGYMFSARFQHPLRERRSEKCPPPLQQKYLNIANFFINEGFPEFSNSLSTITEKILGPIQLQDQLKLEDVERLFQSLVEYVFNEPSETNLMLNPARYILSNRPSSADDLRGLSEEDIATFKSILTDTLEIIESQEVVSLMKRTSRQGFAFYTDTLAESYISAQQQQCGEGEEDSAAHVFISPCTISLPLARLLPSISGLVELVPQDEEGVVEEEVAFQDQWLAHLIESSDIKLLGANIYETFCTKESQQQPEGWIDYLQNTVSALFQDSN